MRACNLGSVEVTQQSAEVPHQMASWVIRLAIKTTGNGRHQVTIHLTEFLSFFLDIACLNRQANTIVTHIHPQKRVGTYVVLGQVLDSETLYTTHMHIVDFSPWRVMEHIERRNSKHRSE